MSCPICTEELNEKDLYILPECDHMFHIDCIISWFRTGNPRCPYCNNPGESNKDKIDINNEINHSVLYTNLMIEQRVRYIKKYIKNNSDTELINLIKKYEEIKHKIKENNENMKNTKNKIGNYKDINMEINKISQNKWKLNTSLRNINSKIKGYPIKEIIIVKKKYI